LTTFHKFQVVELLVCHSGFGPYLSPVLGYLDLEIVAADSCCLGIVVVLETLVVVEKLDCLPVGYMPSYIAELDFDLGFDFDPGSCFDLGFCFDPGSDFCFPLGTHNRFHIQVHLVRFHLRFQFGGQPRS